VLNLLGFLFTFAIGTTWGVLSYKPQLFDSTEPFLILYFGIYLLIPILYAIRRGSDRPGAIDGTLVFANPLIAFSLQAWLLDGERTPLAITAIVLGLIYLVLAALTLRRLRVLGEAYAVLALGFSTLAIPLALSARTTGCVFALEGAALVWLGLRQQRRLPRWIGLLLQVLAALAYAYAFFLGPTDPDALPVANGIYLGALLIALAAFASAWLYQRAGASGGLCTVLYLWGLAWWLGAGLVEIDRHVPWPHESTTVLALFAITAWLAAEAWRIWQRAALAWTTALKSVPPASSASGSPSQASRRARVSERARTATPASSRVTGAPRSAGALSTKTFAASASVAARAGLPAGLASRSRKCAGSARTSGG
jgi:uncharacterized membrane protein